MARARSARAAHNVVGAHVSTASPSEFVPV